MQILKELVYVLSKNNMLPLGATGQLLEKGSKMLLYYEGIQKGKYDSDETAAQELYGDPASPAYRKMKSGLLERLWATVLHFDSRQQHFTDYQKAYYESHQQWVAVKILTGQNANTAAIALAAKLLRQAEKYEFTLLAMDVASYLRIQYSIRESNDKKFKETSALFDYYRRLYDAENIAEHIYTMLSAQSSNNRSSHSSVHEAAKKGYSEVAPFLEHYKSNKLHLYGRLIEFLMYSSAHDYHKSLICCQQTIAFFKAKPFTANAPLQIFMYEQLICQVQLRQFDEGRATAEACAALMMEGSFNWFKYRELSLQLSFHSGHFEEAADILAKSIEHSRFSYLPENTQEIWRIYEAYIYYLVLVKKLLPPVKTGKFKVSKFLNEMPIYTKDKEGVNIAIVVIQYLLLLAEGKVSQVIDRASVIDQYAYRHMSGEHTKRSLNFFKMLAQIPSGQFEREMVRKKAAKYLDALLEMPLDVANQTFEVEVIPYEMLWDIILDTLPKK